MLRDKPYNPIGRFQTEEESNALAQPMKDMLNKYNVNYIERKGNQNDYDFIVEDIIRRINKWNVGKKIMEFTN